MAATNSEILDHLAYCVAEILRDPSGRKDPTRYGRCIATSYFHRIDCLRRGEFDYFLVRMDDELGYQAGSPESRWAERVTRMAALEVENRKVEPDTRCALCRCDAVQKLHGFPVCEYHQHHGEDDDECPKCREERGYRFYKIGTGKLHRSLRGTRTLCGLSLENARKTETETEVTWETLGRCRKCAAIAGGVSTDRIRLPEDES